MGGVSKNTPNFLSGYTSNRVSDRGPREVGVDFSPIFLFSMCWFYFGDKGEG